MKLFDAHTHWLPSKIIENAHFFNKAWGDIQRHVQVMDENGIEKAVLSYPTSDAHTKLGSLGEVARIYNDSVADIIKRYPNRFVGAAVLPITSKQAMLDELNRATQELGFKAVSLASSYEGMYLDDERFHAVYKKAHELKLPIFVHSQIINPIGSERVQDPLLKPVIEYIVDTTMCVGKLLMADIFKEFAEVKFVFAYFGGITAFIQHRYDATYQMLRGMNFVKDLGDVPTNYLKRIYVDTSGDTTLANFLSSLELFGPGHILWGSDHPAKKDIRGSVEIIQQLDISAADKNNMLGGNLERIIDEVKL